MQPKGLRMLGRTLHRGRPKAPETDNHKDAVLMWVSLVKVGEAGRICSLTWEFRTKAMNGRRKAEKLKPNEPTDEAGIA